MKHFTGREYLIEDLLEEIINLKRIKEGLSPQFSDEWIRCQYHKLGFEYWKDSKWFKKWKTN